MFALFGSVIVSRFLQLEKASFPIVVTVLGIVKEVKASQPAKACAPIVVISPSNITVVSFAHEYSIPLGTTVNCFGRVNDTNPQFEKASIPIAARDEGRLISERA